MFDKIVEIKILTPALEKTPEEEAKDFNHIVNISEILENDPKWHFFYECDYNLIRCSVKFVSRVERYLEKSGENFIYKGEWVDGNDCVREHQDIFAEIFHQYALLVIKLAKCDISGNYLYAIADRIIHPFLNNCFYIAKKHDWESSHYYESRIMNQIAMWRVEYISKMDADIAWRKKWLEANEKAKRSAENK